MADKNLWWCVLSVLRVELAIVSLLLEIMSYFLIINFLGTEMARGKQ